MKVLNLFNNRYILTTTLFLLWLLFFDRNSMGDQQERWQEYQRLKEQADYYEKEINAARREQEEIFTSKESLEKFAREKYMMKKDGEELFIMLDTSAKKAE